MLFYKAVAALLNIELEDLSLEDYELNLIKLFGQETYTLAKQHVSQEAIGYDLLHIPDLLAFNNHQNLLAFHGQLKAVFK